MVGLSIIFLGCATPQLAKDGIAIQHLQDKTFPYDGEDALEKGSISMRKITVVTFGASVIEGIIGLKNPSDRWTVMLGRKLTEAFPEIEFDIVNSGIGGQTMREGMARFEKDVKAYSPDYLILGFGGNHDDPKNEKRRVSAGEYRKLLDELKNRLDPKTEIIVMVMPPAIDDQHWAYKMPYVLQKGGMDKMQERDRNVSREFAGNNNYPVIDLSFKLRELMKASSPNYYTLPDGIHLTKNGYLVFTDMAFDIIKRKIAFTRCSTESL